MVQRGVPLIFARQGATVVVTGWSCGCGAGKRLADLGIVPGVPLRVVGGGCGGPAIVEVRGCRLGLGQGLMHKILVKEAES
jgi:ferrous iron transport protein A